MDPLTMLAVIGGASSLIGSAVNAQSVDSTNYANMQIAKATNDTNIKNTQATNETILKNGQMTNDANIRIARETNQMNQQIAALDRAAQVDQWKRETAYNTPAAQAARFRAAGLNPSLASGDSGNAGSLSLRSTDAAVAPTLSSPASGITAPTASAVPNLTAPQYAIDTFIPSAIQSLLSLEDYKEKKMSNNVREAMLAEELKSKKHATRILELDRKHAEDTISDRILKTTYDRMELGNRVKLQQQEIEQRALLYPRQIKKINAEIKNLRQQVRKAKNENDYFEAVRDFRKKAEQFSADEKEYSATLLQLERDFWKENKVFGAVMNLIKILK